MSGERSLRFGVVGLGNIGRQHVELLQSGAVPGAELGAVSSRSEATGLGVPHFADYRALLASGSVEAVIIATPTMDHVDMGLAACDADLHVLMEKPLAMSVADARRLAAARKPARQFAVMLNQRFHPAYARIKQLLDAGRIGRLQRFGWTMTAWYRPDVYYRVSGWRGTWPGEGGGLLINQCIHNLDVLTWFTGLPVQVFALAGFGKYHQIEVEDEVTATLSFADGVTGTVVASSGEAPGINQLDLVGDLGTIRFDGETIHLSASVERVGDHCATTRDMFGMPAFADQVVEPLPAVNQHAQVIENFTQAVRGTSELLTPVAEGVASIELANAMLMSAWQGQPVTLPIDAEAYQRALAAKVEASALREPEQIEVHVDMDKSYR